MLVGIVVGQLDLLERYHLALELLEGERTVGMEEELGGRGRVRLARLLPARLVVGVPVALAVVGQDVHQHLVLVAAVKLELLLLLERVRRRARQSSRLLLLACTIVLERKVHPDRREHSSARSYVYEGDQGLD